MFCVMLLDVERRENKGEEGNRAIEGSKAGREVGKQLENPGEAMKTFWRRVLDLEAARVERGSLDQVL
jgi:hypothetical protein